VLPPYSLKPEIIDEITRATKAMATELHVIGLMNVQYAVKNDSLYIIEVNPRASRTIPFVSKATGVPLAKLATKIMLGKTLQELGLTTERIPTHVSVKEAVMPFNRFPDVDILLGPEMKSTGEVMGIDEDLGSAYAKAQLGAGQNLPLCGTVFISVKDRDKSTALGVATQLYDIGFTLMTTRGTGKYFKDNGIPSRIVNKVSAGRPHVVDAVMNREIQLIINTGFGNETKRDGYHLRRAAIKYNIPYTTTLAGAVAMTTAIAAMKQKDLSVKSLQEY
jgi:carbamoyl-phosphate synthase large subunit